MQAIFWRKSEKSDPDQCVLAPDDLESATAANRAEEHAECRASKRPAKPPDAIRGSLPEHLPRFKEVIDVIATRGCDRKVQKVTASEPPLTKPMISLQPSVLAATVTITATCPMRSRWEMFIYVECRQAELYPQVSGRLGHFPTLSSIALLSFETVLNEIPLTPKACSSSSTRRIDHPQSMPPQ